MKLSALFEKFTTYSKLLLVTLYLTGGVWELAAYVLRNEISRFSAEDLFNADETRLFWQLLPNKTLAFKGERCTPGKNSKERITVLVRANMSGSEKLPFLVIGKSAKHRAFKNREVPVPYKANREAWITDNISGHSKFSLEKITLKFLPSNTTAASQPMGQRAAGKGDGNQEGGPCEGEGGEEGLAGDKLNKLCAELQALELIDAELNDYLAVDDQLVTGGTLSLVEIAADVSTTELEQEEDSETDVETDDEPPLTFREATAGLKIVQRFVEENSNHPALFQLYDKLNDLLAKNGVDKSERKSLLDYFTPSF